MLAIDFKFSKIKSLNLGLLFLNYFSLFITSKGEVYSCGWGADGQLGLGHFQSQWQPARLAGDIQHETITKVVGVGDCVLALNGKYM